MMMMLKLVINEKMIFHHLEYLKVIQYLQVFITNNITSRGSIKYVAHNFYMMFA